MSKGQKILIIRFSSIGDIVLCTAIIRMIHKQLGAEVHLLTKSNFKGILSNNPHVSKIHNIDKDVKEIIGDLKSEKYDLIIDLHKNLRSIETRIKLGVKTLSFNKMNIQRNLFVKTKIDLLPDLSIVDRHVQGLTSLGINNDGAGLDYYYDSVNLGQYKSFIYEDYVVLSLGATHYTKRMTPEVIESFIRQIDLKIIIIGGKDTLDLVNSIQYPDDGKVINLVGKTSLNDSTLITDHAEYIITGDSAMMHIAAALKQPILMVWGSTSPKFGMFPYYGENTNLVVNLDKDLKCRPCTKQGRANCPKGHFNCMNYSESEIKNSIHKIDSIIA